MNATNVLERVPIHTDDHGVVRMARTRVRLESLVDAFETGATAEDIAQHYPTVPLVDVYSVMPASAAALTDRLSHLREE